MQQTLASLHDSMWRLFGWPFRHRPLKPLCPYLDGLLLERPGFWGNLWRLFHRTDWQRSSKFSADIWVVGFLIFYSLASQIGHAWRINLAVALGLDFVVYLFHKLRVWRHRQVGYRKSVGAWYRIWAATVLVNAGCGWLLINQTSLGNGSSKCLLGVAGILVNPLIFRLRDGLAFRDRPT